MLAEASKDEIGDFLESNRKKLFHQINYLNNDIEGDLRIRDQRNITRYNREYGQLNRLVKEYEQNVDPDSILIRDYYTARIDHERKTRANINNNIENLRDQLVESRAHFKALRGIVDYEELKKVESDRNAHAERLQNAINNAREEVQKAEEIQEKLMMDKTTLQNGIDVLKGALRKVETNIDTLRGDGSLESQGSQM